MRSITHPLWVDTIRVITHTKRYGTNTPDGSMAHTHTAPDKASAHDALPLREYALLKRVREVRKSPTIHHTRAHTQRGLPRGARCHEWNQVEWCRACEWNAVFGYYVVHTNISLFFVPKPETCVINAQFSKSSTIWTIRAQVWCFFAGTHSHSCRFVHSGCRMLCIFLPVTVLQQKMAYIFSCVCVAFPETKAVWALRHVCVNNSKCFWVWKANKTLKRAQLFECSLKSVVHILSVWFDMTCVEIPDIT